MDKNLTCEKCGNTGFILKKFKSVDGKVYDVAIECECNAKRMYYARAKQVGLGEGIFDKTFETFEAGTDWQETIKQTALNFCNQEKHKMFYIGGQIGCGKTHICTAIVNNLLERGKNCQYVIWNDIITKLKQTIYDNANKELYNQQLNQLKNIEVLYIDDFFKNEINTRADIDIAWQIINARYMNQLTTIISSERTLCNRQNSLDMVDEAIASRIYELTNIGEFNLAIAKDRNKNYRFRNVNVI